MIDKVIGVLLEQRGPENEHGRIKVISFNRNGEKITNNDEIRREFSPNGYVFAYRFFFEFTYPLKSILEFYISANTSPDKDNRLMDTNRSCRRIDAEVVTVNDDIFEDEFSIDQSRLKQFIQTNSTNFYIHNGGFLYGPFKRDYGEIFPKSNKEVYKYSSNVDQYEIDNKTYLLNEPANSLGEVDCMTPKQLSDWLKTQTKKLDLNIDFPALQSALQLQAQELKKLEKSRMIRAIKNIDRLSVSLQQLKTLANSSQRLGELYEKKLLNYKDELTEEFITPFQKQKAELQTSIATLKKDSFQAEKQNKDLNTKLQETIREYKSIEENKNRIIEDIKIHSLVSGINQTKQERLHTYEEQVYSKEGEWYETSASFIISLIKSQTDQELLDTKTVFNCLQQLSESKFILCNNVQLSLQIGKLSNNCKIILQQVEPDWLKFECFYENGLKQIWKSANENPQQIHFLILEDINIASIECYGRPVLDILAKIRKTLPGLSLPWPNNLWMFGIPLPVLSDNNFSLPLIEETFRKCGAFKKIDFQLEFNNEFETGKILRVDQLYSEELSTQNYLKDFFEA